jgi:hypothetical protein
MAEVGLEPEGANPFAVSELRQTDPSRAAISGAVSTAAPVHAPDADLARVIEAWPALPAHVRAAVLALVQAAR